MKTEKLAKVEALPVEMKNRIGYDICVNDPEATVQDYVDALDKFILQKDCFRSRNSMLKSCFACDLCCQERIPITIIDALKLSEKGLQHALENLFNVYVEERVVDITMALHDSGRCKFLSKDKGICEAYQNRPLVCHTYICCPATHAAKQLREEIVNAGEDELVREWFKIKGKNGGLIIHEAVLPQPNLSDYHRTPFAGVNDYAQIKIKDVCTPELWRKIAVKKSGCTA